MGGTYVLLGVEYRCDWKQYVRLTSPAVGIKKKGERQTFLIDRFQVFTMSTPRGLHVIHKDDERNTKYQKKAHRKRN